MNSLVSVVETFFEGYGINNAIHHVKEDVQAHKVYVCLRDVAWKMLDLATDSGDERVDILDSLLTRGFKFSLSRRNTLVIRY